MKHYVKFISKNYFFKMFKLLLIFFTYIITPVILSTQIACGVMGVQHVIQIDFTQSAEKKLKFE